MVTLGYLAGGAVGARDVLAVGVGELPSCSEVGTVVSPMLTSCGSGVVEVWELVDREWASLVAFP